MTCVGGWVCAHLGVRHRVRTPPPKKKTILQSILSKLMMIVGNAFVGKADTMLSLWHLCLER